MDKENTAKRKYRSENAQKIRNKEDQREDRNQK